MKDNQQQQPNRNDSGSEALRTGQNSEGLRGSQQNSERLNTSSNTSGDTLREEIGEGRSYDYGSESSQEQGTEGRSNNR